MANQFYQNFESALASLHQQNIHTLQELQSPAFCDLHAHFWIAAQEFIEMVVFRSKTNSRRIPQLVSLGLDPEDLLQNALLHLLNKLHLVLSHPLPEQLPYVYTLVNSVLISAYRHQMKELAQTVSLQEPAASSDEDEMNLEQRIADPAASTEAACLERESAQAARDMIVRHAALLAAKPDELFYYLRCRLLGESLPDAADMGLRHGVMKGLLLTLPAVAEAYALDIRRLAPVLQRVTQVYGLTATDIHRLKQELAAPRSIEITYSNKKQLCAQISRLLWRGTQKIKKLESCSFSK